MKMACLQKVVIGLALLANVGRAVYAASGTSAEFAVDNLHIGPWQRRTAAASESLTYSSAWTTNGATGATAVVKVIPALKTKPKFIAIDLSGGTNATHYPISYFDEIPGGSWSDEYRTSKLVLRHIPAGSFIMGGRNTDYPGAANTNLHMVTITRDFYMGVFEVTQRQWELVMGTRPSRYTNETCYATRPVDSVSYCDIRGTGQGLAWPVVSSCDEGAFVGILSAKSGLSGIDLPTDAQWEYACRAGSTTALNSGKNISTGIDELTCPELVPVARFIGNSNFSNMTAAERFASSDEYCSAKVGSYAPNNWGLYDMHGNLWEWCLDRAAWVADGAIDPMGTNDSGIERRMIRGGGFNELAWRCCSGFRYSDVGGMGYAPTNRGDWGTVGFRLCLQGGDVPDFDSASTLVEQAGTGSQVWTPTVAGTYYLSHSTMNGETNACLLGTWFEVPGCTLTIDPMGELTNGVSVAISGAGEGWKVYYTTNGLAPNSASTEYTGPFVLAGSAMVQAVAYNEQGVASEVVAETYTLHDALNVASAVARQRYPWNGMVDVDVDLKGNETAEYLVSLVAQDMIGGSNLTVRTVSGAGILSPGKHRITWDAAADIANDCDFGSVAVTVKAAGSNLLKYARTLELTVVGYEGTETLTNVPMLVRLSPAIEGFNYADFTTTNGSDLAFFDENQVALPHEIDEWHPAGESLVWVKLPELKQGTRFTAVWGRSGLGSSAEEGEQAGVRAKHEVWREYAGVWHMNEDSGTAYDSTEHHLDGIPSCGTNELADVSQMVAYENGACGRARVNATIELKGGTAMCVPSYDALHLGGRFVIDGWFLGLGASSLNWKSRLFNRKYNWDDLNGWEIVVSGIVGEVVGASSETTKFDYSSCESNWGKITVVYDDTDIGRVYTNGVFCIGCTNRVGATDNGMPLYIGCTRRIDQFLTFAGQYDEVRLRGGLLSADRIKADYDMIKNRGFLHYGTVVSPAFDISANQEVE